MSKAPSLERWQWVSPVRYAKDGPYLVNTRRTASRDEGYPPWHERTKSVEDIEEKCRLYLRLADLVELTPEGKPRLRADWTDRAVDFSNLWAPLVDASEFVEGRMPLAVFAREAFLIWWTLNLKERVMHPKEHPLFGLLVASVQVMHLLPDAPQQKIIALEVSGMVMEDARAGADAWERASNMRQIIHRARTAADIGLESSGDTAAWQNAARDFAEAEVDREMAEVMTGSALPLYLLDQEPRDADNPFLRVSLPRDEASRRAQEIGVVLKQNRRRIWSLAASVLSHAFCVRLDGIGFDCDFALGRGAVGRALPRLMFPNPTSQVWFRLWEDIGGIRLRSCASCGRLFIVKREDGRFCSGRCRSALHMREVRRGNREEERRQGNRSGKRGRGKQSRLHVAKKPAE